MTAANGIANLNLNDPATPPSSPPSTPSATAPALTKAQILSNVLTLATQFSTCVEAFNLIHPSKETDHAQKVALAKIGLQQGRLLIFGDAVGISSPPATIARHMIPSHPGATNPDPHLPVNFGIRDPRLDEAETNDKVRAALNSIAGRPNHLSREEMMERYGLKSPKTFKTIEYPALDTNRLEAFREKYALLQDLVRQTGARANIRRGMSMMMTHWVVRDADKFNAFVQTVRIEVDGLIDLMGVKEQVDRGIRSDIRAMGWHPDLSGPVVHQDWEKLRLIREACVDDYPEYVDVADNALKYMVSELQGTRLASLSASYQPAITLRRKSEDNSLHASQKTQPMVTETLKTPEKEKRPGWLSHFKWKSWNKNGKGSPKHLAPSSNTHAQRSLSDTPAPMSTTDDNTLEPVRSKSLSAIPDEPAPLDLDSKIHSKTAPVAAPIPEATETPNGKQDLYPHDSFDEPSPLTQTETAKTEEDDHPALIVTSTTNSLVERHDMYRGVGRIVTSDIREKSHEAAAGK